jgi:hypothetical protein
VAGSARYTAILDANVLYPQLIRDTLLSLAVERMNASVPDCLVTNYENWPTASNCQTRTTATSWPPRLLDTQTLS